MIVTGFSAILKVFLVFFIMFSGIRIKISIPVVFVSGASILALFFTMSPGDFISSACAALISEKTICLASIIALISIFGKALEETGSTERMTNVFRQTGQGSQIGLAALPALIGLLPVPGGAVFSAPLVKSLAVDHDIGPSRMSLINYWFRHIWEYNWPLYPGVLLASTISGMGLGSIAIHMLPFNLLAIVIGLSFIPNEKIQDRFMVNDIRTRRNFLSALKEIMPIFIVVIPSITIAPLVSHFFPKIMVIREIILMAALLAGIIFVTYSKKDKIIGILLDARLKDMTLMVLSIMIFKKILEDTGAAASIGMEIGQAGIPVYLAAFLLPFITGMVTGISVAFVGISLPVIVSISNAVGAGIPGNDAIVNAITVLAISSGFMGVMLSPLHLCLILSNSYFEADQKNFYKKLIPACLTVIVFSFFYYRVLRII